MGESIKTGIIICDRYRNCADGKCLRAMHNKEGAFAQYGDAELELVSYTTCNGCPGNNVENTGGEMVVKNGAQVIHLATGLLVGYPPCPYIQTFIYYLQKRYDVKVVVGAYPIPNKYLELHTSLGTRKGHEWPPLLTLTMTDEEMRMDYD